MFCPSYRIRTPFSTCPTFRGQVTDLFGPKYRFSIPTYQRQYSWLKENAEQLFDDIAEEALSSSVGLKEIRPYFVGSMVLVKKSDNVDAEVIDGQQRLTTLTILLAAIRDTSSKRNIEIEKEDFSKAVSSYIYEAGNAAGGIKASYRLHVRPADQEFFQVNIQRPGGILGLAPDMPLPDSRKRLVTNALAFMAKLEKQSNEQVIRLGQYILQKVTVALVTTSDEEAAFRIFSVLNDRGMELSPADILKAEVVGSLPEADRAKYSEKWEEAEKDLGKERFDELITHIRMIGVKRKSKESTVKEIRETLKPRENAAYFVDKMVVPYADIMIELKDEEIEVTKSRDEIARIVGWLNQITSVVYVGHWDWVPVALELINRLRLVFFVVGAAIFLPTADVPMTVVNAGKLAGMFLAGVLIVAGVLKVQMTIARMGRPPHTVEFTDQRIKMVDLRYL